MPFKYEDYTNNEGIRRFREVSTDFDFGPVLPKATLPENFVDAYVCSVDMEVPDEPEYFSAPYSDGVERLMLDSVLCPRYMHSTNAIVAESLYAPSGSIILPPGYYIFGDAYSSKGQHMLLVNLREDGGTYGSIHAWQRSHDPWGEGDNIRGLAPLAPDLGTFLQNLTTDAASLE